MVLDDFARYVIATRQMDPPSLNVNLPLKSQEYIYTVFVRDAVSQSQITDHCRTFGIAAAQISLQEEMPRHVIAS